jgi:hypothetical protein
MANLTLRQVKGSPLTIAEMDGNFEYFTGSYTNTGTITAQGFIGSFTGSLSGSITGNAVSASYAITASYTQNALTASYVVTAQTASYVNAVNVNGTVANALTASYVVTAQTASYVNAASINGTVANATTAITASFVSSILTIAPINPLPSPINGAIAFSSSGNFYFGSGSAWNKLNL